MPIQLHIAGIVSLAGMGIMALLILFFNKESVSEYEFWNDYFIYLIIIFFWFNNINLLFLVLLHYLNIVYCLIYNKTAVFLESALNYLIIDILLNKTSLNLWYITVVSIIAMILPCLSIKFFHSINKTLFTIHSNRASENITENQDFLLNKTLDMIICIFLPLFPILIIILYVLAGL